MLENSRWRRSWGVGVLLLAYVCLALAYSIVTPIFEAPDELQHAFYIKQLAEGEGLPVLDPEIGRQWHEEGFPQQPYTKVWAQEGGQPPLYYLLGAGLTSWIDLDGTEEDLLLNPHANIGNPLLPGNKNRVVHSPAESWPWRGMPLAVHVTRLLSIALGASVVYLTYRLALLLFPNHTGFALAAASLTAFLPQFLFISAAVSNDNLMILLASWTLWLLVRVFGPELARTPGWKQALGLGVLLGLAGLTKLSGMNLWALVAAAYVLHALLYRRWRAILAPGMITFVAAAGIAGWWFIRNLVLYNDPTGLNIFLQIVGNRPETLTWNNLSTEFQSLRVSLLALFGWFNILAPDWVYRVWDAFLLLSASGFVWGLWRRRVQLRPAGDFLRRRAGLFLLLLWVAILGVSLWRWTTITLGTQGRLLLPAITAISILAILGWTQWLWRRTLWRALPPAALLLLSIYSVVVLIPGAYRPPALMPAEDFPEEIAADPILTDGRILRLGVAVEPETVHPGDEFDVTIYWQATKPIPYNASLFIHLLGRDNALVGQLNTYPGWGNFATSLWPVGPVIVDQYRLQAPRELEPPLLLTVDVGLFDYETQEGWASEHVRGQSSALGDAKLRVLPLAPLQLQTSSLDQFRYDSRIHLEGFDLSANAARPGETLDLSLYWRAKTPIAEDYQVFVHLMNEDWQRVAGYDTTPGGGWWPTSAWEPEQLFADQIPVHIPDDLSPGRYTIIAGLYQLATLERLPVDGPPDRIRDRAALLTTIEVRP